LRRCLIALKAPFSIGFIARSPREGPLDNRPKCGY